MKNNDVNQPNINIESLTNYNCECGNGTFDMIYKIKKLSKFQSPSGKEEFVPIQLFYCTECKKIQYQIAGLDEKNEEKNGNQKENDLNEKKGNGVIRSLE